MAIEPIRLLDMVSLEPQSGTCRLTLVEHLTWDDSHLLALQEKINACLQFIESGELHLAYPAARDLDFLLDIRCIYAPDGVALAFLAHAQTMLEDAGYLLRFGPLGFAYADVVTE